MTGYTLGVQLLVYSLVGATVALGLPLFHYVTALMVAVLLRHGRGPSGLLTPVGGAARLGQRLPRGVS